jgi:hypothetical protein
MDHGLFVAGEIITKALILPQRLANTPHIAMSEDSPHPCKKSGLGPITFHVLILQESNQRLRHC